MKVCFNQATTLKNSNLETDLVLCEKHGYDLIEIRLDKLKEYLETNTVDDLVNFFQKNKIKPYAFNALEFILFRNDEDFANIVSDLFYLCEIGVTINCDKIVVVPTFDVGDYTIEEIKAESVKRLNQLADVAQNYGMKLAFEFVGYPHCSVNTFGQAYDIVEAVNRPNVGIVLDCFHFHAMGSSIEDLRKADPEKLFIFHIDDSENLPVGALRDHHRLWPGDGAIDLDSILKTLLDIGYSNMVSIELFRPEYWDLEAEETIRIGMEKTKEVISKYFKDSSEYDKRLI